MKNFYEMTNKELVQAMDDDLYDNDMLQECRLRFMYYARTGIQAGAYDTGKDTHQNRVYQDNCIDGQYDF